MNTHKNARLTYRRRLDMVHDITAQGMSVPQAASCHGVTAATARKWLGRYLARGEAALVDASSRPVCSPRSIAPATALAIVDERHRRRTHAHNARVTGVSSITTGYGAAGRRSNEDLLSFPTRASLVGKGEPMKTFIPTEYRPPNNAASRARALPEISPDNVDALEELDTNQLKVLWIKHYRRPPPPRARKSLMVDCLAYRIQELAHGGLALSTRTKLKKIATDIQDGKQIALLTDIRIKAGTRLVREWGGQTHTVEAVDDDFTYRDKRYGNLSEIAGVITGSRWSGPLFFGIKKRKPAPKGSAHAE